MISSLLSGGTPRRGSGRGRLSVLLYPAQRFRCLLPLQDAHNICTQRFVLLGVGRAPGLEAESRVAYQNLVSEVLPALTS